MKDRKIKYLTAKEFEIMNIFWDQDRPLTGAEIICLSKNNTWSINSLYPLLRRLLAKGFLEISGNIRQVKAPSRIFKAKISGYEYSNSQLAYIYNDDRAALHSVLSFFSQEYDADHLMAEITAWINEHKNK